MNQRHKSVSQNWFKSQRTFSFVSGTHAGKQAKHGKEWAAAAANQTVEREKSVIIFSKWCFFPGSFILGNVEMKWSLQSHQNEIYRNGACQECKWARSDVPLHLISTWMHWWVQELWLLGQRAWSTESKAFGNSTKGCRTLVQRWHKAMKFTAERYRHSQPSRPCLTNSRQSWTKSFQAAQFQLSAIALIRYIRSNKSTFWCICVHGRFAWPVKSN